MCQTNKKDSKHTHTHTLVYKYSIWFVVVYERAINMGHVDILAKWQVGSLPANIICLYVVSYLAVLITKYCDASLSVS